MLTYPCSFLPGNCNASSNSDPVDSANGVRGYSRFGRKSGFYLSGGRGRLPWCVLVHHPISVKGRKGYMEGINAVRTCLNCVWTAGRASPRNKIHLCSQDNPRKRCTLLLSRTPYLQFPCYSNLPRISISASSLRRSNDLQWQPLYLEPPSSEMNCIELFGAVYSGCRLMNSMITKMGSEFRGDWE